MQDVTVTVDPIRRDSWIYDGERDHKLSQMMGDKQDMLAIQRSLNWEKAHTPKTSLFLPTTGMIDGICQSSCFAPAFKDNHEPGFYNERRGKFPVITQLLYDGSIEGKGRGEIEHEMREADRRSGARLFDKSGYSR